MLHNTPRLSRSFFRRDPVTVARALLGQRLVHIFRGQRLAGLIVETEAYLGIPDKAAHTFGGRRTARNESMWADGGHAYVYFTYGMHFCLNVVTERANMPTAVLIRALEPTEGLAVMQSFRPKARHIHQLCSGPAKLCQALAINRQLDSEDLVASNELFIERLLQNPLSDQSVSVTPRIGIAYAGEWAQKPLRFFVTNSKHSGK